MCCELWPDILSMCCELWLDILSMCCELWLDILSMRCELRLDIFSMCCELDLIFWARVVNCDLIFWACVVNCDLIFLARVVNCDLIFWARVVNCDSISSKHSTVTNLETCILDALYPLLVKYYIVRVLIVQFNLSFKLKNHPFHNTLLYNKTNQMHWFLRFILAVKLYIFRTVPLPITRSFSLYIQQW
jgi:hypothetical protein